MIKDSAYSVKSISADAVVACVLGGLSLLGIIGAILASYLYDGKGPAAIGLLGIGGFIFALVGLGFSITAWKSQDGGLLMKRIAIIVNAIPLLGALILYILGWVL